MSGGSQTNRAVDAGSGLSRLDFGERTKNQRCCVFFSVSLVILMDFGKEASTG